MLTSGFVVPGLSTLIWNLARRSLSYDPIPSRLLHKCRDAAWLKEYAHGVRQVRRPSPSGRDRRPSSRRGPFLPPAPFPSLSASFHCCYVGRTSASPSGG